jgi:hypothetical protein
MSDKEASETIYLRLKHHRDSAFICSTLLNCPHEADFNHRVLYHHPLYSTHELQRVRDHYALEFQALQAQEQEALALLDTSLLDSDSEEEVVLEVDEEVLDLEGSPSDLEEAQEEPREEAQDSDSSEEDQRRRRRPHQEEVPRRVDPLHLEILDLDSQPMKLMITDLLEPDRVKKLSLEVSRKWLKSLDSPEERFRKLREMRLSRTHSLRKTQKHPCDPERDQVRPRKPKRKHPEGGPRLRSTLRQRLGPKIRSPASDTPKHV